jgi:hypothetical protein
MFWLLTVPLARQTILFQHTHVFLLREFSEDIAIFVILKSKGTRLTYLNNINKMSTLYFFDIRRSENLSKLDLKF